jgi:tetratricopeptide (TPR) repeat protein
MIRMVLAMVLMLVPAAARAEWWRAETDHFVIYSEDKKGSTQEFAVQLERFDNALRMLQNMPTRPEKPLSRANKLTIFRTGTIRDMAFLYGAPGSGVAGFYIPRAGAAVAFTPAVAEKRDIRSISDRERDSRTDLDPRSVLQHEYVHHFMLQTFPATYPDWYIEAFAELYGTIVLNPDGSFKVGSPPQYRAAQIYQLPDFPLKELFDQNDKREGVEGIQFYGYGWLLAHYLSFEPKRKGQLRAYLKALDRGEDGLTAARNAFGDLGQLAKEVRAYKSGNFPGFAVKPANYTPPTVDLRPLTEAEAAVMSEYMRSRRGVNRKQARDVAADIEPEARRYSDNLFVQLAASEAFLDARRFDEADAAADRALAIDPESTDALILKGMIGIARGKAGDKARFAAARAPLAKATRIDPEDPRPFIHYYESFSKAGDAVPEAAVIGLEQVFRQAAFDRDYRLILARQLLIENNGQDARNVLAPIAYRFHGDQKDNKLRPVIDLIQADKVPEARAKLEEIFKKAEEDEKKD